jgi:hypothetical protein
MSNADNTKVRPAASVRWKAGVAGLLYLLVFIAAPTGAATATPLKMIVNLVADAGVALILYSLLRPVARWLSLLAASFRLIFVAIMALNALNYFGAVAFSQKAHSASTFNTWYEISMAPFGAHCLLIGYLMLRSRLFPRLAGFLMMLAGAGYLTFLWPHLGGHLFFPWIAVPGIVGEGLLTLWLLGIGLNITGGKQRMRPANQVT